MGMKLPPLEEELYRRTDEVLHYIWDPIGVAAVPVASDEYHSCLPQVFGLLKAKADAEAIASYLTEIATQRMGLSKNRKRDLDVAELLLYWQQVINDKGI